MNEVPELVSVLMTAYNREVFISEAIESVLASNYKNIELIIVDDGSKDSTVQIAEMYVSKDPRIKLFINDKNLGDYPNRNKAASYATGKYLMYVDSDDTIEPDAISYIMKLFHQFPEASYSTIYRGSIFKAPCIVSSKKILEAHFFNETILHFGPGGTIIKNDFFKAIGRFPTKYGPANDMFYNIKAASNTPVLLLPYDYLHYRRHDGQEINNGYSYLYNGYLYFTDAMSINELPLSKEQRTYLLLKNKRRFITNTARFLFSSGSIIKTLKVFKLAKFTLRDLIEGIFHKTPPKEAFYKKPRT